ncbi:phosphoribosylamine--glycine ligase [Mesoterricola silvestris]|uniref:Phosphoribosylamine--glycine ligase n=1 Tax=Mesoterricola silvestris TaxID=2927979 RepID=A0AA48GGY8_9BACT|nr:phosphoribosylamine--glycine ligase [Mesoterricola silvestris]BDU72656.1 phosphoribosylamine--glycine ligase [Mesoterricola silvestris]
MKILLIGSGGREHALAMKLKSGPVPVELFAAPGSDALAELGTCLAYPVEDIPGITAWCARHRPDLVVVGPEVPLVAGLADALRREGVAVFGHDAATARLEGSKAFAKDFMVRHGIPCAGSRTFTALEAAEEAIRTWDLGLPIVLKADGLAAGKGVVLAGSPGEALATVRAFMAGQFGEASRTVVLEAPLVGMELSLHVLVDVDAGHAAFVMLPPCQDHKRIFDGDRGPNTGGMGAFGPIPFLSASDLDRLRRDLVEPTVAGLAKDGLRARGVLFLGVMWTARGPELLEYNVRFGDPETQVLMELLDEDLATLLLEVAQGRLRRDSVKLRPGCAITVVLAAGGYPEGAEKDVPIALGAPGGVKVVHAGTRRTPAGWVTAGGRVLNLVATAPDLEAARARVEAAVAQVGWPGMQRRSDIGLRALNHAKAGRTVGDAFL